MDGKKFVERLELALNVQGNNELARLLGGTDTTYSNWRTGYSKPKVDILLNEIGLRGINIHWLLTGEGRMYSEKRNAMHESPEEYCAGNMADVASEIGKRVIEIYELLKGRKKE